VATRVYIVIIRFKSGRQMKVICERNNYQVLSSSIESISKRRIDNVIVSRDRDLYLRENISLQPAVILLKITRY
jgi:hypothetical protein